MHALGKSKASDDELEKIKQFLRDMEQKD